MDFYKRIRSALAITSAVVIIMMHACSRKDDVVNPTDAQATSRKAMLTNLADNIIIPSYGKFKARLDAMTSRSNAFTTTPNATTLGEFRTAWIDAYTEWQRVELFDFGPGQVQAIRSYFNIYPASETGINTNINSTDVNMDVPASYPTQGFPALDYLINGLGTTDAAIVAFYTTDASAAKRIGYLKLIVAKMNTVFNAVNTEWNSTYRNTFVDKSSTDAGSSLSLMVNGYILNYERYIRSGKFGIPSGAMTNSGGTKFPDRVEAYYKKDISTILAKAAHQASVDFFNGKNAGTGEAGPSLKTYLDGLGAKDQATGTLLAAIINTQFAAAASKLEVLPANLFQAVQSNNQVMIDVYNEMQKAVRMLKVDMTSAISITITYTDNDGD